MTIKLDCDFHLSGGGDALDRLIAIADSKKCPHSVKVEWREKTCSHVETVVVLGGACFNADGVFGSDCGKPDGTAIRVVARQTETGVSKRRGRKQNPTSLFLRGKISSFDPKRLLFIEPPGSKNSEVEFCIPPFVADHKASPCSIGEDWVSYSVTPKSEPIQARVQIELELFAEEPDSVMFGNTMQRVLDKCQFVVNVAIPSVSIPPESPTDRHDSKKDEDSGFRTTLDSLNFIRLTSFKVLGDYVRTEDSVRIELLRRADEIKFALAENRQARSNWLIWGTSGSGKSFFIEQIAKSLNANIQFDILNMLKIEPRSGIQQISEKCDALVETGKPFMLFLDEIDGRTAGSFAYETLCHQIDRFARLPTPSVCVMAGSNPNGMNAMQEFMKDQEQCKKGQDLLTRIPKSNIFSVPDLTPTDQACVFGSHLLQQIKKKDPTVHKVEIEKLAILWVLQDPHLKPARRIADLAAQVVERIKLDRPVVFEKLATEGDQEIRQFLSENPSLVKRFSGKICTFEE